MLLWELVFSFDRMVPSESGTHGRSRFSQLRTYSGSLLPPDTKALDLSSEPCAPDLELVWVPFWVGSSPKHKQLYNVLNPLLNPVNAELKCVRNDAIA